MNKDEYTLEIKDDNIITFSIINTAIIKVYNNKIELKKKTSSNNIIKTFAEDKTILIKYLKSLENLYKNISKEYPNIFRKFKRNINYINYLSFNKQDKIFK